jgi:hypothetical protein
MMTREFESRAGRTKLGLAAITVVGGLILAGCSAEAENTAPGNSAAAMRGVLETSAGLYEFTPATCAIYRQDGAVDIEVQGPGTASDGEKFFFELSSTANAMTIGLGVDGPFASPERKLEAGRVASQEFTIMASERQLSVSGLVLVDENGRSVDGDATLQIDCGA